MLELVSIFSSWPTSNRYWWCPLACVPRQLRNLSHYFQQITSNSRYFYLSGGTEKILIWKPSIGSRSNKFSYMPNRIVRQIFCLFSLHIFPLVVPSLSCLCLSSGEVEALPGWQWFKHLSPPHLSPPPAGSAGGEFWLRLSSSLQNIDQRPLKFFSQAAPDWGILSQSRHHREIQGPIID